MCSLFTLGTCISTLHINNAQTRNSYINYILVMFHPKCIWAVRSMGIRSIGHWHSNQTCLQKSTYLGNYLKGHQDRKDRGMHRSHVHDGKRPMARFLDKAKSSIWCMLGWDPWSIWSACMLQSTEENEEIGPSTEHQSLGPGETISMLQHWGGWAEVKQHLRCQGELKNVQWGNVGLWP